MATIFCVVRLLVCVYIVLHGLALLNSMGCRTRWARRLSCVLITTAAFADLTVLLNAVTCGQLATVTDIPRTLLTAGAALLLSQMSPFTCSWENHNADRRQKQIG